MKYIHFFDTMAELNENYEYEKHIDYITARSASMAYDVTFRYIREFTDSNYSTPIYELRGNDMQNTTLYYNWDEYGYKCGTEWNDEDKRIDGVRYQVNEVSYHETKNKNYKTPWLSATNKGILVDHITIGELTVTETGENNEETVFFSSSSMSQYYGTYVFDREETMNGNVIYVWKMDGGSLEVATLTRDLEATLSRYDIADDELRHKLQQDSEMFAMPWPTEAEFYFALNAVDGNSIGLQVNYSHGNYYTVNVGYEIEESEGEELLHVTGYSAGTITRDFDFSENSRVIFDFGDRFDSVIYPYAKIERIESESEMEGTIYVKSVICWDNRFSTHITDGVIDSNPVSVHYIYEGNECRNYIDQDKQITFTQCKSY